MDKIKKLLEKVFVQYAQCEGIELKGLSAVSKEEPWPEFYKRMLEYLERNVQKENSRSEYLVAKDYKNRLDHIYKMGDVSLRLRGDNYIKEYMAFLKGKKKFWLMRYSTTG